MDHLALAVRDQARSRRFYENYFGCYARGMCNGIARASESAWRATISAKTG